MGSMHQLASKLQWPFAALGMMALKWATVAGGLVVLLFQILIYLLPWKWDFDGPEIWRNMYRVGVQSFPIVVVTAVLVGAIMVIQSGLYIEQYQAHGLLGWGAGYAILREVGPILIGLMFSGRVGANNTAELGTMKVTDQIDALRALAIDPVAYLVVPRFLSMILMMFLLVVVGNFTALVGGAITSQYLLGVDMMLFYQSVVTYVLLEDLWHGLFKSILFGVAIAVISCYFGLSTRGGAVGVGRAVNASVVGSAIAIFAIDYFVAFGSL